MNKITTVLLGLLLILLILLILPSASCRSPQVINEDDYTFIAIVYSEIIGDEDPKHLIRNLDGTPFDTLDMKAEYNLLPLVTQGSAGRSSYLTLRRYATTSSARSLKRASPYKSSSVESGSSSSIEQEFGSIARKTSSRVKYSSLLQLHMEKSCP